MKDKPLRYFGCFAVGLLNAAGWRIVGWLDDGWSLCREGSYLDGHRFLPVQRDGRGETFVCVADILPFISEVGA